MSTVVDAETLRARFVAAFPSNVQQVIDNQPPTVLDKTKPYVRFSVTPNSVERTTFGVGGKHQRYGMVWLQVIIPNNIGTKQAYELVDAFTAVFRNWRSTDGKLWCDTETVRQVPAKEYYQVNVSVSYTSNL